MPTLHLLYYSDPSLPSSCFAPSYTATKAKKAVLFTAYLAVLYTCRGNVTRRFFDSTGIDRACYGTWMPSLLIVLCITSLSPIVFIEFGLL